VATASLRIAYPKQAQVYGIGTGGTGEFVILSENDERKGAIIVNEASRPLYVLFGDALVSSGRYTVLLAPWATYELSFPPYQGRIVGTWGGPGTLQVTEIF